MKFNKFIKQHGKVVMSQSTNFLTYYDTPKYNLYLKEKEYADKNKLSVNVIIDGIEYNDVWQYLEKRPHAGIFFDAYTKAFRIAFVGDDL